MKTLKLYLQLLRKFKLRIWDLQQNWQHHWGLNFSVQKRNTSDILESQEKSDVQGLIEYTKWKVRGFCVNVICSSLEVPNLFTNEQIILECLYILQRYTLLLEGLSVKGMQCIAYSIPFCPSKLLCYLPPTESKR